VTSVARHREQSLPNQVRNTRIGSADVSAPRPTCSRVTTTTAGLLARGSLPSAAFPGQRFPVALMTEDSPLTVAGAAADSDQRRPHRIPI
jgi:hypothetical protein